ncbi:hypothetical protein ACWD5R_44170 [Streptomyces sp. NPDC002514]|uniref:hypothetical protein n=1 Tax=Streptomyces sp. NPDC001270 TaxID=3364554 RepID=UPI0036B3F484
MLFTLSTNEPHGFCRREGYDKTTTPYFGGTHWQAAVPEKHGRRKAPAACQQGISEQGLFTGGFGIRVSSHSARCHLDLAAPARPA